MDTNNNNVQNNGIPVSNDTNQFFGTQTLNNVGQNNVTPTPMPAMPNNQVLPEPLPAAPETINPTPLNVQPEVVETQTYTETPQPEVMGAPQPETVSFPTMNSEEVTVISTYEGKKGGGIAIIIIVIILILFIFNIDKVEQLYNDHIKEYILIDGDAPSGNTLNGGYILVNDNSSEDTLEKIRFYNFSTNQKNKVTFNYNSSEKYQLAGPLEIYIEVYDASKNLIYKELFNPGSDIKKNTVRVYEIELEDDLYNKVRYVSIKKYTTEQKNSTSTLKCTQVQETNNYNIKLENTYHFKNNELIGYSVSEKIIYIEETSDVSSYKSSMIDSVNNLTELDAKFENNELKYYVDLSKNYSNYNKLYNKGLTPVTVKSKEENRKWKCE